MTDPTPEPRDHDPVVADAADRLQAQARQIDTMGALGRVAGARRPAWAGPGAPRRRAGARSPRRRPEER